MTEHIRASGSTVFTVTDDGHRCRTVDLGEAVHSPPVITIDPSASSNRYGSRGSPLYSSRPTPSTTKRARSRPASP